jgi:hypothetical protein
MSADNWAVCPKCRRIAEAKKITAKKHAAAVYGYVSQDTYQKFVAKSELPIDNCKTLREDYSIGVRDGAFSVSYFGSCKTCGFTFEYKTEEATEC